MIIFELEDETHNSDGSWKCRPIYWLGSTILTGSDENDADEIYEQLTAREVFLCD